MATVALPAAVTMDQAGAVLRTLEAALAAQGTDEALSVDASALVELDTAAIALLLQAQRLAARQGRRFELAGAPNKLIELARLYGVESLLGSDAPA